jgi:hypothetical protein
MNYFGLLSMRLSWFYYSSHMFGRLTHAIFFSSFLIFFKLHHSTLDWLRIVNHDLFRFSFYEVISVSWPGSRVRLVNSNWPKSFLCPFFNWFFFDFIIQHWVNWEMSFIIYLDFFSIGLSWSHDEGHEFSRLTQAARGVFFLNFIIQHRIDCELGFTICFNLLSVKVIMVSRLGLWIWQVNLSQSNMLSSRYFKNKIILNLFSN